MANFKKLGGGHYTCDYCNRTIFGTAGHECGGMMIGRIMNEDCLITMNRMDDNFIDLTVTSPPYDNLRDYKGYSFEFERIANELYRVTKQGGVVVWIVGDATIDGSETGTSFRQALYFKQIGFNLHDTMIYGKSAPMPTDTRQPRYRQAFEFMFILTKGKPVCNFIKEKSKNAGKKSGTSTTLKPDGTVRLDRIKARANQIINDEKIRDNIWYYDKILANNGHPAVFPEQLAADHIYSWSNEGDLIYDCFGGSGTTIRMAEKYKRKWIMSEISKEYCNIAKTQLEPYLNQTVLF